MAIVGVRTELEVTAEAANSQGVETNLTWWMENSTSTGESSALPVGTATNYHGKALNFIGNKGAQRELTTALNTSPLRT